MNNFNDYGEYAKRFLKYIHDHPKQIDDLVIQSNQLRNPYRFFLSNMERTYKQYASIDDESIIRTLKAIDKDWPRIYMAIISYSDVINPNEFQLYQTMMIEYSQKDTINKMVDELNKGKISPNKFLSDVKQLEKMKDTNEPTAITDDDLERRIRSKPNTLKFGEFGMLSNPVNVSEHDFVVIAGSTGLGKTAYALNLAYDLGKRYPVLYFNMEMSRESLEKRIISNKTGIPLNRLNNCSILPQPEINKIRNINIEQYDVKFKDESQTIDGIEQQVAKFDQSKHFIVFVDHIGLVSSSQRKSRYEQITEVAMRLRALTLDYNCTVFGLCQLSRSAENADHPSLSLLRDSGEIEQSARKVIMLWDADSGNSIDAPRTRVMAYVLKNSEGQRREIPMIFWKTVQRFQELQEKQ